MWIAIIVLRAASLLAFAALVLLGVGGRRTKIADARAPKDTRVPVAANMAAVALFFASLAIFAGSLAGPVMVLAASGASLALAGAGFILRSRDELGAAWSLAPKADHATGLVTTGPYRLVRHPIYLGFVLLATGQALAFASLPALVIVAFGLLPSFAWRAYVEERLLGRIFGARYAAYRQRTTMIIPYLL